MTTVIRADRMDNQLVVSPKVGSHRAGSHAAASPRADSHVAASPRADSRRAGNRRDNRRPVRPAVTRLNRRPLKRSGTNSSNSSSSLGSGHCCTVLPLSASLSRSF